MNYKEIIFFIAKSLTISLEEENKDEIELILKTNEIDWDNVVKVSTSHYVFSAMHCNFKRAGFLKYLPADLVNYMTYITDSNRERNIEIVEQAKRLNSLLLNNGIRPLFLKGVGNILEGLYDDVGERMVIDIDLLFSESDFFKAIDIIESDKYKKMEGQVEYFPEFRHYSRLVKLKNIAPVEIHKEVIREKFREEFNCKKIFKDPLLINGFSVLNYNHQLSLSIITGQINDYGFELNNFSLRDAYDVFLLSKKTNTKMAISDFIKLKSPLNCFLANCNLIFGDLQSLNYFKTKESKNHMKRFSKSLLKRKKIRRNIKLKIINLNRILSKICKSIFNIENRKWLLKRIKNKITS